MSFFCGGDHDLQPSAIMGNPGNGLCEKVCLQVKKVFDACISQTSIENCTLTLCSAVPENSIFISGKSVSTKGIVDVTSVEAVDSCQNLSRLRTTVTIPMSVCYTTPTGDNKRVLSNIVIKKDVLLCLPEPSIIPYEIEAVVSAVLPEGDFTSCTILTADACVTIILKVVTEVELLVPTYGYCQLPPCQEYTQEVCAGFFNLPLFPKSPCCRK